MKRGSYERIQGTEDSHKNLNSYMNAGFYNVKTSYVDNCPSGIGYDAVLLIYEWNSSGYVCQEITETAGSTLNRRWIRHQKDTGSTWTDWSQIAFITDNVASATKLETGRTLKVNLASTSASTAFNGTANITNIGVSGTLPIANGGTGATTAAAALNNLGLTATAAELNKMDGVTVTTAELNYVDGVTSNIQTQLNGKAPTSHASTATTYGAANASNYGHAMASSTTPKANGTAAVGSETAKFARGDHVHPLQTSVSGNAGSANKLQTYKTGSTTETYGDKYPLYAQWNSSTILGLKCDGYTVNTDTATKLATPRTISLTGDVTGSVSFDGSANASITATVADNSHNHNASNITAGTLAAARLPAATTSAQGAMTASDKTKLNATNIAYGTCSTAAATAAKVITISGNTNWALAAGSMITVKFTYTNSASNPTFNVNSTGAKKVWYNTALITTSNLGYAGTANRPMNFVYDGTQYVFVGWSYDTNSTYSNASLGQGYGTCATAAATVAKVVTLSSYALTTGGIVSVKFTYAVPANATMNINSKGAKPIYYQGAAITAGIIKAGDVATFIYNGSQYHLIAIDSHIDEVLTLDPDDVPTDGETNLVNSNLLEGMTYEEIKNDIISNHTHAYSSITGKPTFSLSGSTLYITT